MDELTPQPRRWDDRAYQRLVDATGAAGELSVTFENGDRATVDLRWVLDRAEPVADWSELRVAPFGVVLTIEGEPEKIGWMDIRAMTDSGFAAHLADRADDEARQVGHHLRLLRQRRGMSGRELAERAGLAPQSLSRIERGRHDIVFSTLQRLLTAMNYDLADLAQVEEGGPERNKIESMLRQAGLSAYTVERVMAGVESPRAAGERVRQIFGWSSTDLAGDSVPPLRASPAFAGRRKDLSKAARAAEAYVVYAYTVASIADQAAERPDFVAPTADPVALGAQIRARYGALAFADLLRFCWDSGMVVVALEDPGQLHGACWLIDDHPVILLKQSLRYESRWAFDLGHELGHIALHLQTKRQGVIEFVEIGHAHDEEEQQASDFAGQLLLGDPEALAHGLVAAAGNAMEALKATLPPFAAQHSVDVGVLANYVAYRINEDQANGQIWGVAANLQSGAHDPIDVVRSTLSEHLDWSRLSADEIAILRAALGSEVS